MKHARVHTLSFELPRPDSDVVIRAEIHQVEEQDGKVEFISGTTNEIFRLLPSVLAQQVSFVDPVTQEAKTVSVAGLTQAVTEAVRAWMIEDIDGGSFDENNKYIIEE
ncbi:MAG: hypothetical protein AAGA46_03355 [Cyanobacteria bacterium P01_F01_bin.13]